MLKSQRKETSADADVAFVSESGGEFQLVEALQASRVTGRGVRVRLSLLVCVGGALVRFGSGSRRVRIGCGGVDGKERRDDGAREVVRLPRGERVVQAPGAFNQQTHLIARRTLLVRGEQRRRVRVAHQVRHALQV